MASNKKIAPVNTFEENSVQSSASASSYRPITSPISSPRSPPYTVATSPISLPGSPVSLPYSVGSQPIMPECTRENMEYYGGYHYPSLSMDNKESANIINKQRSSANPCLNDDLQQSMEEVAAVIRNSEKAADSTSPGEICPCPHSQKKQYNLLSHLPSARDVFYVSWRTV